MALQLNYERFATPDALVQYHESFDDLSSQRIGRPYHGDEAHRRVPDSTID
ncbi:MAG TPA: hypothetical protein VN815_06940 [Steroidobacteraceae bacterium]|nr:hypothetical protein [Steroidobacteraceae bacterium]